MTEDRIIIKSSLRSVTEFHNLIKLMRIIVKLIEKIKERTNLEFCAYLEDGTTIPYQLGTCQHVFVEMNIKTVKCIKCQRQYAMTQIPSRLNAQVKGGKR
jgi:hypothetical protein